MRRGGCRDRSLADQHNGGVCGRYAAARDAADLAQWFHAEELPTVDLPPRYNVAPTSESYIVIDDQDARVIDIARWGLIPSWSTDASRASRMINARCETVAQKPAYRSAFKRRRCLVPVDGYYEWQAASVSSGSRKQPFFIRAQDDRPLALAGLFEDWTGPEGMIRSFTVLTQEPTTWLAQIHDRMPVIVHPSDWSTWLDASLAPANLDPLLHAITEHSADGLEAYPVSTIVNRAGNEGADLVAPIGPPIGVG